MGSQFNAEQFRKHYGGRSNGPVEDGCMNWFTPDDDICLDGYIEEYEKHGEQAIETLREEQPVEYLRLCFKYLPKDLLLSVMGRYLERK